MTEAYTVLNTVHYPTESAGGKHEKGDSRNNLYEDSVVDVCTKINEVTRIALQTRSDRWQALGRGPQAGAQSSVRPDLRSQDYRTCQLPYPIIDLFSVRTGCVNYRTPLLTYSVLLLDGSCEFPYPIIDVFGLMRGHFSYRSPYIDLFFISFPSD